MHSLYHQEIPSGNTVRKYILWCFLFFSSFKPSYVASNACGAQYCSQWSQASVSLSVMWLHCVNTAKGIEVVLEVEILWRPKEHYNKWEQCSLRQITLTSCISVSVHWLSTTDRQTWECQSHEAVFLPGYVLVLAGCVRQWMRRAEHIDDRTPEESWHGRCLTQSQSHDHSTALPLAEISHNQNKPATQSVLT